MFIYAHKKILKVKINIFFFSHETEEKYYKPLSGKVDR